MSLNGDYTVTVKAYSTLYSSIEELTIPRPSMTLSLDFCPVEDVETPKIGDKNVLELQLGKKHEE